MDPTTAYVIGGVLVAGVIVLAPVFKVLSTVMPFAYTNARIRAMRNKFVKDDEFKNYLRRKYMDTVYELEKKNYPELSTYAQGDLSFAAIDSALRTDLVRTLLKVRRISPQQMHGFIDAVLSKYDLQIIESVVRSSGVSTNVTHDILHNTSSVFSEGFLTRDNHTIEELYNEIKGTEYEAVFVSHMDEVKKGEFEEFEHSLDLVYFRRLLHRSKTQPARSYTKKLIDIRNVSLALKGKTAIIPGGIIRPELLTGKSLSEIKRVLREHGYPSDAETITAVERDLQLHMKKFGRALLTKEPLSAASVVGFIAQKTINVRNTAILLKMQHHAFDEERIAEVIAI